MYGIDMFTPIINQPESAILGTGRITDKAVVIEKSIQIRPMMVLSLTADHRVIDGVPASQFLNTVKKYIECPENLLK
jgi:pyruvate dehydrogenase E2 component (dihydrolipoamide acetyltransferase)